MIKTGRLQIYPASRSQMEAAIEAESDEEMKKAYNEMLDGCLQHPGQWDWYAMWMIELHDGTHIGDLCFKGLMPGRGRVMLLKPYRLLSSGLFRIRWCLPLRLKPIPETQPLNGSCKNADSYPPEPTERKVRVLSFHGSLPRSNSDPPAAEENHGPKMVQNQGSINIKRSRHW